MTRKVEDQDEKLEDDLGAVVVKVKDGTSPAAKVRDGTSPDTDGVGPRVVEPKTQEPSDEPPEDKSLLIHAEKRGGSLGPTTIGRRSGMPVSRRN